MDKDRAHTCDPCLTNGEHVEAHRFCAECQELFCTACCKTHENTNASKSHQLQDKHQMHKQVTLAKDLKETMAMQDSFGKLICSTSPATPEMNTLRKKGDIQVRTESDRNICNISGCVAMSPGKLVLADYNNNKLKVVNTYNNCVTEQKVLDSEPFGVAILPGNQLAVTMPHNSRILILSTVGKLSTERSIAVEGECWGITHHQDHLYVVTTQPNSVVLLDMLGNIRKTTLLASLSEHRSTCPWHVELSTDKKLVYVSDWCSECVVAITLQGEVSAVYTHKHLTGPTGLLVLEDGSLLVCGHTSQTVHHISADLQQGRTLIEGAHYHQSICCSWDQSEVYAGSEDCDILQVFSLH